MLRRSFRYAFLALVSSPLILAAATPGQMVEHDSRDAAPDGFVSLGPVSTETSFTIDIGLARNNMAGLETRLYDVSTPGGVEYGKHLSKEEVESYVSPTAETVSKVQAWLQSHGLSSTSTSATGDWISVTLPISKANELLDTNFEMYRHEETGTESIQTLSYSVPSELTTMIDAIEPTTSFPNPYNTGPSSTFGTVVQTTGDGAIACDPKQITPHCLQTLYGIPLTHATRKDNVLAVPGFLDEYANFADLRLFISRLRPDLKPQPNFTVELIDGGKNPQTPGTAGVEANLDIQYTVGLVNYAPVTFISSGLGNINGFINLANSLLAQRIVPKVLSVSYGFDENQLGKGSATNLCNIFMQLGARGTSVIFASGDGGVGGSRPGNTCTTFIPTYPAGCPYITAVGATQNVEPEIGAGLSAGGFSNYFAQPKYQTAAVKKYRGQIGTLYRGRYNPGGRAYPDVSAQGENIVIVGNQTGKLVGGTSASAPIFASIITLLNDRLLTKQKRVLGFLNPLFYAYSPVFTDITSGSNPGCGTKGFPAKAGWDPVTGVGTPVFQKLAKLIGV